MLQLLLSPLRGTTFGDFLSRSPLRPQYWKASYAAARTLWFTYGHLKSVQTRSAVDANGEPLPWYTYPAIEYLKQFDFSDKKVFEYGSGNSTLFWARRALQVVSVEDDERWHAATQRRVPANSTLILEPDLHRYVDVIKRYADGFDIIVVDGPARGRTRLKCARAAVEHLRPGGLIILDNSDWLPESASFLRGAGLLQVDMSGFIPIGGQTQTTTLFFDRRCQLQPLGDLQPHPSAGALPKNWEETRSDPGASIDWDGETIAGVVRQATMWKDTPGGPRKFDIAVRPTGNQSKHAFVFFVYDVKLQRILLGPCGISPAIPVDEELGRLAAMSWDEFRAFAQAHSMRRYSL